MTPEQKDRILSVIERDAAIRGRYVNGDGEFCIIGGLLDEMGVDVKAELFRTTKNTRSIKELVWLDQLQETFGLAKYQLISLQDINDGTITRTIRQSILRQCIEAIWSEQEKNAPGN